MFREMRRIKQALSQDECTEVLKNEPRGVLSLIEENGYPYGIPMDHWYCEEDGKLYFHCAKEGRKLDILNSNPNVCISFVTDVSPVQEKYTTLYKSAVVKGKAVEITDKNEKKEGLKAITEKFAPDFMNIFDERAEQKLSVTSVWKVEMEEITGKGNI